MSLSNLSLSHAGPTAAATSRPSVSTVPSIYTTPSEYGGANGRAPSTAYAPSVVSTVRAAHGHPGESTTTLLPDGVAIAPATRPNEVPPTSKTVDAPKETASKLPPAVGHTKALDRKGLMARIGSARKVSSEKITKFFAAAKPEPPLSSSSSSELKGGLFQDLKVRNKGTQSQCPEALLTLFYLAAGYATSRTGRGDSHLRARSVRTAGGPRTDGRQHDVAASVRAGDAKPRSCRRS